MALRSSYKRPASQFGGVLHREGIIDALALSDAAGVKRVVIASPDFTQNTTVKNYGGALGFRGKLVGAYVVYETVPAGGTLAVKAAVYDASATAEVILASADPETATASIGLALTLDATLNDPFIIEPTDSIRAVTTANNSAVGTQQVGGVLVLLIVPIEPAAGALVTER